MNYSQGKIEENVNLINELLLRYTDKEVVVLKNANCYEYNKAVAVVNKNSKYKDWYGTSNKTCYKSWNEIQAFLEGLCLGKNADFTERDER